MTAAGSPAAPTAAPRPIVLRALSSAVLLDGSGDVSLVRESRGTSDEWGGVYARLVRLTGRWAVGFRDASSGGAVVGVLGSVEVEGDRCRTTHRFGPLSVVQEIVPWEQPPGALRTFRIRSDDVTSRTWVLENTFVPFLFPPMVEGIRPVEFRVETSSDRLSVRQRGFGLEFRSSVPPSHLLLNRASWLGGRRTGRIDEVGSDHPFEVAAGSEVVVRMLLSGGLARELGRTTPESDTALVDPEPTLRQTAVSEAEWLARTPTLRFPDAPELERAYESGRRALRQLYSAPGDGLTGLVAGYPWYPSIWCRDVAWMLPAVLWLGDRAWFDRTVDTIFRFQARSRIPIVGGEPGELPMQLAPGPVFLYGTSDTTLYFPELLRRRRGLADAGPLPDLWTEAVRRIVRWGFTRTDPASGLLRNGGEAEAIGDATTAVGRVHYGIDSPDTTIWDSADRRDHAIDVQVLWYETLRAAAAIDDGAPGGPPAAELRALAERLATTVRERFAWPEERYLADSIRAGAAVRRLRPNALRAVSAGLVDPGAARAIVARAGEDDLTTPWGVRTLSTKDPEYRPAAYHAGQVWTIATAWAADAAFAVGDRRRGIEYLRTIAARYAAEGGGANECYRGDRPEPFDSCFLLGLSVGPFLTLLFERLWGIEPDVGHGVVRVRPAFPDSWRAASLEGLRVGEGTLSLEYRAPTLRARWSGPGPLALTTGTASARLGAHEECELEVGPPEP